MSYLAQLIQEGDSGSPINNVIVMAATSGRGELAENAAQEVICLRSALRDTLTTLRACVKVLDVVHVAELDLAESAEQEAMTALGEVTACAACGVLAAEAEHDRSCPLFGGELTCTAW